MLVWSSLGSQSRLARYIALPFPEAMYSIQHINGYFVELFFFPSVDEDCRTVISSG